MAAYLIVQVEVTDPVQYENYKKMVPPTLEPFGGKFVVRGAACENLEGKWQPKRLVVIQFPSVDVAKKWWASSEYRDAKSLRQRTAKTEMIVVEGVV